MLNLLNPSYFPINHPLSPISISLVLALWTKTFTIMYQIPFSAFQNQNPLSMPFITHSPPSSSPFTIATSMGFTATPSNLTFKKTTCFPFSSTRNRSRFALVVRAKAENDYYSTLNVSNNASLQEIKSSYRKLARKVWFLLYFKKWALQFVLCFDLFKW